VKKWGAAGNPEEVLRYWFMTTLKTHSNRSLYSNTVIGLAVDRWAVTFGTAAPPSPLLAVPNVTDHLSTASVYQLHIIRCGTIIASRWTLKGISDHLSFTYRRNVWQFGSSLAQRRPMSLEPERPRRRSSREILVPRKSHRGRQDTSACRRVDTVGTTARRKCYRISSVSRSDSPLIGLVATLAPVTGKINHDVPRSSLLINSPCHYTLGPVSRLHRSISCEAIVACSSTYHATRIRSRRHTLYSQNNSAPRQSILSNINLRLLSAAYI